MDRGIDFLKSQVNNAVMQHRAFLDALEDHEKQAEDIRFRDLCSRHIPNVREHQRMLEDYQQTLGAEAGEGKKILVSACTSCHDLSEVTKFRGYYDRKQWRDIVVTMMDYGAPVNEKQVDVLADYLAEHLGKQ